MLLALVEFHHQAVNIADHNHQGRYPCPPSYQQNQQNSEKEEENERLENAPECQALWQAKFPTLVLMETLWTMTTVFQPSCAGRRDGGC